jgi:hypothetical protein
MDKRQGNKAIGDNTCRRRRKEEPSQPTTQNIQKGQTFQAQQNK